MMAVLSSLLCTITAVGFFTFAFVDGSARDNFSPHVCSFVILLAAGGASAPVSAKSIPMDSSVVPPIGDEPPRFRNNDSPSPFVQNGTTSSPSPVKGTGPAEGESDVPDGLAVQRAFLVLAGLGIIVIAYMGLKFLCGKKRRRARNPESSYGLVETSEMDLLENEEEDDEGDEDDTLFDLHSHRRT